MWCSGVLPRIPDKTVPVARKSLGRVSSSEPYDAALNLDYSRACGGGANGERGWGKRVELVAASSHESKSFRGGGDQVQPGSKSERGKHTSAWAMQTGLFFGSQQNRFSRWPPPGRHSARAVERASRWRSAPPPGAPSGRSAPPV